MQFVSKIKRDSCMTSYAYRFNILNRDVDLIKNDYGFEVKFKYMEISYEHHKWWADIHGTFARFYEDLEELDIEIQIVKEIQKAIEKTPQDPMIAELVKDLYD